MKTKWSLIAMFLLLGVALAVMAQTAKPAAQNLVTNTSANGNTNTNTTTHTWHLPSGFTADQAYKSNCTRCHAEVPKMSTRRTKTIVQHMRVRANLTQDEAEAILEYLNK
jgi:hypothetical protein